MAEISTEQELDVSMNGHRPLVKDEAIERLANNPSDEIFIEILGIHLAEAPYPAQLLHEKPIMARCGILKRQKRPLYKGRLWPLIKKAGDMDAWEWDREIDEFAYLTDRLTTMALSSVEQEEVSWLWEPYIPYKKLTLVEGDPEAGKTYLLLALAAAITRGFSLPDQRGKIAPPHGTCGTVLYLTAEDGIADTIRKRAERCDADLDRIFVVPNASMFPDDLQPFSLARPHLLSAAIEERQASLVILDPLTAFLGGNMDMNRANEVRSSMSTLGAMATKHSCAIVAIRHWTKVTGGRAAYRGQGNIDFFAAARSVLAIGESPEEEGLRVIAQSKNSLHDRGVSIAFVIKSTGLEWAGTSAMTADELSAAQPQRHKKPRRDAMEWLRDFLRDGPQQSGLIFAAASAEGVNEKSLRRAKEELGITAYQERHAWWWRLPRTRTEDRRYERDDDRINFFERG